MDDYGRKTVPYELDFLFVLFPLQLEFLTIPTSWKQNIVLYQNYKTKIFISQD
jgi:hypothetical protein